jgi:hypothetical protein
MNNQKVYLYKPPKDQTLAAMVLALLMLMNGYLISDYWLQSEPEACTFTKIGGYYYPSSTECVE